MNINNNNSYKASFRLIDRSQWGSKIEEFKNTTIPTEFSKFFEDNKQYRDFLLKSTPEQMLVFVGNEENKAFKEILLKTDTKVLKKYKVTEFIKDEKQRQVDKQEKMRRDLEADLAQYEYDNAIEKRVVKQEEKPLGWCDWFTSGVAGVASFGVKCVAAFLTAVFYQECGKLTTFIALGRAVKANEIGIADNVLGLITIGHALSLGYSTLGPVVLNEWLGLAERKAEDRTQAEREEPGFVKRMLSKFANLSIGALAGGAIVTVSAIVVFSIITFGLVATLQVVDALIGLEKSTYSSSNEGGDPKELLNALFALGALGGMIYTLWKDLPVLGYNKEWNAEEQVA